RGRDETPPARSSLGPLPCWTSRGMRPGDDRGPPHVWASGRSAPADLCTHRSDRLRIHDRKRTDMGLNVAIFGSSLVSAYWNGAATYYRGLIKALHARGHRITFFEPDAYDRQRHRDLDDPEWARVVVY